MKTIFRNLVLGMLVAVFAAITVTPTFAQDPQAEKTALYQKYMDNYNKDIEKKKIALEAAKQYVEKYGASEPDKEQVDYFKTAIPTLEKTINEAASKEKTIAVRKRFETAVKGTNNVANPSETYAAGKEIVAMNDEFLLDVLLTLGSAGFDQASAATPVDTYNNETIDYAKQAIQKLEANATSATKNYGVYQYSYKTDKLANGSPNPNGYADGKANALGAMNYNIGYILYYRQGKDNPEKRKEALPYLYKATQYNSYTKKNPFVYQTIGAWYLDEAIRIDKERQAILAAMPEKERKDNEQTLAMVGMQKGYADRAIDAYARAYKIAKDDKDAKKEYVDGLYTKLKDLYAFRFDNNTTGIDTYVASVQSKPLPDPTTAITPVAVEPTPTEPTTPANTTTPPNTTTPATTPANTTTKPATTTTPKPATTPATTTKKPVSTTDVKSSTPSSVSESNKSNVKKPAPKKKGTR